MPCVHVFKIHNALGIRCLYSLRVDYTSQNSYDSIHCLRLLGDLVTYIAIIPDRAFWSKKAHPGATQDYMESYPEQVDPDEYTPTTENSLYKTINLSAVRPYSFRYKAFYRLPRPFQVRRERKSFSVAVQAWKDKSSRRVSIPRGRHISHADQVLHLNVVYMPLVANPAEKSWKCRPLR